MKIACVKGYGSPHYTILDADCSMGLMHFVLLLGWMAIAALLRFINLESKPLWADEFSTLVFSLGNSYLTVPTDHLLTWRELLQPLQPDPQASVRSVVQHLLTESNHPPLYFLLGHLWLRLFPAEDGLVSVWAARSLSAGLGVAAVPAAFGLGWLAGRSRVMGHLAAALMACSPFGIYLAQEARHYTLAVLWIMASLACLVVMTQCLQSQRLPPLWLCCLWIGVNGFGIATHYFVLLSLAAAAIALGCWYFVMRRSNEISIRLNQLWRLALVAIGTLAATVVWLPVLLNIRGTELTRWIQSGEFDHSSWLDQLLRPIAATISMLYMMPIQGVPRWMVIVAAIVALLLLVWTVPLLVQGWRNQAKDPALGSTVVLLGCFVGAGLGLSFVLTFGFGVNFTSVFRYQFIHFPAVIVLLAIALADYWQDPTALRLRPVSYTDLSLPMPFVVDPPQSPSRGKIKPPLYQDAEKALGEPRSPFGQRFLGRNGNWAIAIVLSFSLLGGLTVTTDLSYQRVHRPDLVAAAIAQAAPDTTPPPATLIAIPHKTHAHSGRLMAIAWELNRINPTLAQHSTYLLAHYTGEDVQPAIAALESGLKTLPRPLEVWRVNFRSEANPRSHAVLSQANCSPVDKLRSVDGYRYQPYHCR